MFKLLRAIVPIASMSLVNVVMAAPPALAPPSANILRLPNHDGYDCTSVNSSYMYPPPPPPVPVPVMPCSKAMEIQVVPVLNMASGVSTCIAVLPYNSIHVHRSSSLDKVTLTWTLPSPQATDKWRAKFASPGMVLSPQDDTVANDDLFEDSGGVSADKQTYVVTMMKGAPPNFIFNHLPVVKYTADIVRFPKFKRCFAIDPTISNSAD